MAKQIDSLFLDSSTSKDTSTNVKTKSEKSSSSLFDSLLKESFKSAESSNAQNTEKTTTVKNEIAQVAKTEGGLKEVKSSEATSSTTEDTQTQTPKTSSLLDKLILEAKKEVKTVSSEEVKEAKNVDVKTQTQEVVGSAKEIRETTPEVSKNQENIKALNSDSSGVEIETEVSKEPATVKNEIAQVAKTEGGLKEVKSSEATSSTTEETQTQTPKTSSLLDKLILEAKKEVKTVSSEEVKEAKNVDVKTQTQEVVKEVVGSAKEIRETTPEVSKNQENIKALNSDSSGVEIETEVSKEPTTVKNEIAQIAKTEGGLKEVKSSEATSSTTEDTQTQTPKTSSLLDKLILEAKKEVKTVSSEEVKEAKNVDVKTQTQEVVKEVVGSAKEIRETTPEVSKNQENIKALNSDSSGVEIETEVSKEPTTVKNEIAQIAKTEGGLKEVKSSEATSSTILNNTNTNEKVSAELASLNTSNEDTNLNISKEQLLSQNDKVVDKKTSTSLMDQLIVKNRQIVFGNETPTQNKQIQTSEFLTSIYLGNQKNSISNQSLINKKEAVNLASNATTLSDVKSSAEMLDLGLEDIDVQKAIETIKKLDLEKVDRTNLLDKLAFNKNIVNLDLKDLVTKSVEASKALLENTINVPEDLELNVNSQAAQSIQARIVGARQQMTQMMSDVARQMYENYKPPVTAFRINLNPATLGAISILMKNDRDNSLSISMTVSSNSTLDSLVENQNNLRNSLNKLFDENTKFNLDFNSSSDNNQSSNGNSSNSNSQQFTNSNILNSLEEDTTQEEKNIDYM